MGRSNLRARQSNDIRLILILSCVWGAACVAFALRVSPASAAEFDAWTAFLQAKAQYREWIRRGAEDALDQIYQRSSPEVQKRFPRSSISVAVVDSSAGGPCYDLPELAFTDISGNGAKIVVCNEGVEAVTHILLVQKFIMASIWPEIFSEYEKAGIEFKNRFAKAADYYSNYYQAVTKAQHLRGKHPSPACWEVLVASRLARRESLSDCSRSHAMRDEEFASEHWGFGVFAKSLESWARTVSGDNQSIAIDVQAVPKEWFTTLQSSAFELVLQYAVWHEFGHIADLAAQRKGLDSELAADRYAVRHGPWDEGNMIAPFVSLASYVFWLSVAKQLPDVKARDYAGRRADSVMSEICGIGLTTNFNKEYSVRVTQIFTSEICARQSVQSPGENEVGMAATVTRDAGTWATFLTRKGADDASQLLSTGYECCDLRKK